MSNYLYKTVKHIVTIFLLFALSICHAQTFTHCDVYQYEGADSTKKILALQQTFNAKGQLVSEIYNNYRFSNSRYSEASFQYYYRGILLVKKISRFPYGRDDKRKTIYHYNFKRQLIKEKCASLGQRLKKSKPGEWHCVVKDEDFKKRKAWKKLSVIHYRYDKAGNKIEEESPRFSFSTEDKYTWEYDSIGRMVKNNCYGDDRLLWTRECRYFEGGYTQIHTWYDYDGKTPCYLIPETEVSYIPQWHRTYYLDNKNRVIKEVTKTEKGETRTIETTEYNSAGQISKTVYYNKNNEPEITHLYVYY